jgi:hypothetical protein
MACRSPVYFLQLSLGNHTFLVRAIGRRGRRSATARFFWMLVEPKDFSIVPDFFGLSALYPGAAPVALPLELTNPNAVPIVVTDLRVSLTHNPDGCNSAENLKLTQSNASNSVPLKIPASGTVQLPSQGVLAPKIQLRDLPVNQNACQNTQFPLAFSGAAHG